MSGRGHLADGFGMSAGRFPLRHRLGRPVLAAVLAATGLATSHLAARPAAATDCVTYYCADASAHLTGSGYAHIFDDQGELDCYYNAGSESPSCHASYYWIGELSPTLTIHVTLAASANSYICAGSSCLEPGQSEVVPLTLARNSSTTIDNRSANLAKALTVTVSNPGDGSGSLISDPLGIDCDVAGSATKGTCSHLWYFIDHIVVTFYAAPAAGDYICGTRYVPWSCLSVGQQTTSIVEAFETATDSPQLAFMKGHPIVSVGIGGQGQVSSDPPGISCPSTCSSYFPPNTALVLNAAPKAGSVFTGWTGACAGHGATCSLSLGSTDVSTKAVFAAPATPAPTARATASPRPGATPVPTTPAGASAVPLPIASGSSPVPLGGPGGSPARGASSQPIDGASPRPIAGVGSPGPSTVISSPAPALATVGEGGGSGIDPGWLVAIGVLVIVVLALGLALRRRGRTAGQGSSPMSSGSDE